MKQQQTWLKLTLIYILLIAIALSMLFPLFWLVGTSFKSAGEDIFTFPPRFIPEQFTFETKFLAESRLDMQQFQPFVYFYFFYSSFLLHCTASSGQSLFS